MLQQNSSSQHGHPEHGLALFFFIEETKYEWHEQYITGAQIRALGNIGADETIFLAIKRPWDDEVIEDDSKVDIARDGIERFYVRKNGHGVIVTIKINDKPYEVKRGNYTVAEIKKIGNVPAADILSELIDGKLVELKDNEKVKIKGSEEFFSCKRDGTSS